ncbi:MAG: pyridoxal 5'-phosphate synthase glutaminase subunit PdxT [Chloroflexi bacterium]|nr:pyridoxal 5'-phosphate synthase glutaminase subunit PdxT [Chloroflexota bacterium]
MKVGVLALQGDFREHIRMLRRLGVTAVEVRQAEQLADLDGLIIPGGESTTIGKLATQFGLMEPLRRFGAERPIWGTCAGMIFLARDIGRDQPLLGLMDISVNRNAFGRQVDSFEAALEVSGLEDQPFKAIFIRAPLVTEVDEPAGVEILARLEDGGIVAVRQGHLLATAFHTELTGDDRLHHMFIEMIQKHQPTAAAS